MTKEKEFYSNMRETEDGLWYTMARDMAGTVNVELIKPRSVTRSMHRPNALLSAQKTTIESTALFPC